MFALAGVPLEEDIIGFEIPVNDLPPLYVLVALYNLLEDVEGLVLRQAVGMLLDVLG